MPYQFPEKIGNYRNWEFREIVYNSGPDGWSVAEGTWCGDRALGIRWNGGDTGKVSDFPKMGRQSVWFIVPRELEGAVRGAAILMDLWKRGRNPQ